MQQIGKLRFSRKDVIGTGRFGTVYKGEYEDVGPNVAVKRVLKLNESQFEVDILSRVKHANILKYYGQEENDDFM